MRCGHSKTGARALRRSPGGPAVAPRRPQDIPYGEGLHALAKLDDGDTWIQVDDTTRIRADKVVSVKLYIIENRIPFVDPDR